MNRSWLPLLVGSGVLAAVLLAGAVISLVRGLREEAPLAELPLLPEQEVRLETAGPLVLDVEGPLLTGRFRGLSYQLVRRETGQPVRDETAWFRESRTGGRRARVSVHIFALEAPGTHLLRVEGLQPDVDYSDCRLLLRPDRRARFTLWLAAHVLAIIAGGGGLLLAIILSTVLLGPADRPGDAPGRGSGLPGAAGPAVGAGPAAAASTAGWTEMEWPAPGLRLRLPPGWRQAAMDETHLRLESADEGGAHLRASVTAPASFPLSQLLEAHLRAASNRHRQGAITGFAPRTLGRGRGVLSRAVEGGRPTLLWEGFLPPEGQPVAVTITIAGAAGQEAVLEALLESLTFR
jgi:hypothetical protein